LETRGWFRGFRLIGAALAAGAVLWPCVGTARAGTYTAFTCHDPANRPIGAAGWNEQLLGGAYFAYSNLTCGASTDQLSLQLGPSPLAYKDSQGKALFYTPPAGVNILTYWLSFTGVYTSPCGSPNCGHGDASVLHAGQSDPNYDWRQIGNGQTGPFLVVEQGLDVPYVRLAISCDGFPDPATYTCPSNALIASMGVSSGGFKLFDSTIPQVTNIHGPLASGKLAAGTEAIHFTATDAGSGIYSAIVKVDGKEIEQPLLDSNHGTCVDLGQTGDRTRSFASPQPCATAVNANVSLNTSKLRPGRHRLSVLVDDAAGDRDSVFDGVLRVPHRGMSSVAPRRSGSHRRIHVRMTFDWFWSGSRTRLGHVTAARFPRNGTVHISCSGRGCPRKSVAARYRGVKRVLASLKGTTYHAGDLISVVISAPGRRSERIELRIRNGKIPAARLL
jgi:hypothetical protein